MAAPPPSSEPVSSTRLYLGNLPQNATKADVENHFNAHGGGKILEVKLMSGFGFIEYDDSMDARDVVPAFHGSDFMGNRLVVQFARGSRPRSELPPFHERLPPRTRRTVYRMSITGLPPETSWQDLKDFARTDGLDVVYSEVARERDGKGFVEYETESDLKSAVDKMDGRDFKGAMVQCFADIQPERPRGERFRSRSPPRRGPPGAYNGGAPAAPYYDDYYDRRGAGPPRGFTPRGYRERSPPRRDYYDDRRSGYGRSPPPPRARGPPMDDYGAPPPRRGAGGGGSGGLYPPDDYLPPPSRGGGGYGRGPPAPYADDPYSNGHRGPSSYDRPPMSPPRRRSPGPPPARAGGGYGDYDRRGGGGYWY